MYHEEVLHKRPWRIVDTLEQLFRNVTTIVIPTAFVHMPGQSRSSAIVEVISNIFCC